MTGKYEKKTPTSKQTSDRIYYHAPEPKIIAIHTSVVRRYVSYCMKLVNTLLARDIKPILIFDGQKLPAKAGTEKKREQ